MKKLQIIKNELIQLLDARKELLNTITKNKEENDKKEFSQEQVLKGQEINNQLYNIQYLIEESERSIYNHDKLIEQAKDYINDIKISYEDFLTLCDIYGIKVSPRTKGHLKNADACIKNGTYSLPKKMRPSNVVLNLSEILYDALINDIEESKEKNKINDLSCKEESAIKENTNNKGSVESMSNNKYIYIYTKEFTDNKIHQLKDYTIYIAIEGEPKRGELKKFKNTNNNELYNVSYNTLSRYRKFTLEQYKIILRLEKAKEEQEKRCFNINHKDIYNRLCEKIEKVYNNDYTIKDVTIESIATVGQLIPSLNKNFKDEYINKEVNINIDTVVKSFKKEE